MMELEEIHAFATPGEFNRFLRFLEESIADGYLVEIDAEISYGKGMLDGGRWFRVLSSCDVWRLVPPDIPFRGLWERVDQIVAESDVRTVTK